MSLLDDFKQQNPEYAQVPDNELVPAIYNKFYKDQMSPEEFSRKLTASESAAPAVTENTGLVEGTGRAFTQGATWKFGDEIVAGLASVPTAALTDLSVPQAYEMALDAERQRAASFEKERPIVSGVSEFAGALGGSAGLVGSALKANPKLAADLISKGSKNLATKATAASGLGGISAGSYGFGAGTGSAEERFKSAQAPAAFGAVLGSAGAVAAPAFRVAAKGTRGLTQRAKNVFGKTPATQEAAVVAQRGGAFPLTKGQAVQSQEAQSLENMSRAGVFGDKAQQLIQDFDYKQQDEILGFLENLGANADEAEELMKAAKLAKSQFKSLKGQVSKAYDTAKGIQGVYLNKQPMIDTFVPSVKSMLKEGGFDIQYFSPQGRNLVNQVLKSKALKDDKVTALNLGQLENWRKQVGNVISENTDAVTGQMKPEAVALSKIKNQFDDFMEQLPRDALKSGDANALTAIQKARGLRAEQGRKFDRVAVVKDIVKRDSLTNEELANMVLTGTGRGQKINSASGRIVKDLKKSVGENAPEMVSALKKGTMARVLRQSKSTVLRGDTEQEVLQAGRLAKNLDEMLRNKTFVNELFEPKEVNAMTVALKDLRKIASEQKGANNYSNTAYTLARMARVLPFGLEKPIEALSNVGAKADLRVATQQFINEFERELVGGSKMYGALATAPIATGLADVFSMEEDNK